MNRLTGARALARLIVVVAMLGPACGGAAEATTGVIAGTVSKAGGVPIPKAVILATSPSGEYRAVADGQGRFVLLGVAPDTYSLTARSPGYEPVVQRGARVEAGQRLRLNFTLTVFADLKTIAAVHAGNEAFSPGATSDGFNVNGAAAGAQFPATSSAGLALYSQGTVQGAIANDPGVDLDPFGNAILRGGRVSDAAFEFNSVRIPQGLIAEPGGNVAGAQLATTGIASTHLTLAGYMNESVNALGGVVNQLPAVGTFPGSASLEVAAGAGTQFQFGNLQILGATQNLAWRYAVATTWGGEYFPYGDGSTFYPSEAGTYGLALQSRSQFSLAANVHYRASSKDDIAFLGLFGQAHYDQYGSPYAGETAGAFDGATTTYPGETNPNAPVDYASGINGSYDVLMAQWLHTGATILSRVQLYESQYISAAGGPFWDDNGFPDGAVSLSQTSSQRQYGINVDNETLAGRHHLRFGLEGSTSTSYLNQVVPTADEFITSNPTVFAYLAYAGDVWSATDRLELMGALRGTYDRFLPSTGVPYGIGAIDPHLGASYRIGSNYALRFNFDRITVAPAPLEVDRTDSANVDQSGHPPPFVELAPETASDFTYSFEGGGRTPFRLTYYQKFEQNLIDVLPYNFKSAVDSGLNPDGLGVPTNVGQLRASGVEAYVQHGGLSLTMDYVHASSSSASQFAYNDLNAPAVAANHLFPVSYEPDFAAELSYEFSNPKKTLRLRPSLSYSTGYPYGNGKMAWVFDPGTGKPVQVPNDNYVNPGANYYFLKDPASPYNPVSNPYIGTLGTGEGSDPNTLRSTPQTFVNLHVEADLRPNLTAIVDVANLLGNFAPTAYQSNPYLIGPPGYGGGNAGYAACYVQILAGTVPCSPGLPAGTTPYKLGNGVPTNNGVNQSVPWTYGTAGYVPQSYPMGRTVQFRLRYRW